MALLFFVGRGVVVSVIIISIAIALLAGCLAPADAMSHTQIMPNNSAGVRAGCIRTLARIAINSGRAAYWSPDYAASFCDDVERSFQRELHERKVQSI